MQKIQAVFQAAQKVAKEADEIAIENFLSAEKHTYLSVAFEGVACGLAENDIKHDSFFSAWQMFLKKNPKHTTQIHIGLGWALALSKTPTTTIIPVESSILIARVFDGYGYTEGLFRKRVIIQQKTLHSNLTQDQKMGYDQGLGRSLWYGAKGDVATLKKTIETFPADRLADLWRGVGIAVGYVGGLETYEIKNLESNAGVCNHDFQVGLLLSQLSRFNSLVIDNKMQAQILSHLKKDINAIDDLTFSLSKISENITYGAFLNLINEELLF